MQSLWTWTRPLSLITLMNRALQSRSVNPEFFTLTKVKKLKKLKGKVQHQLPVTPEHQKHPQVLLCGLPKKSMSHWALLGTLQPLKSAGLQKWILTNRFHVAVHLFGNRLQITPKHGKNKKGHTRHRQVSLIIFSSDPSLYRPTKTWNLFLLYEKKAIDHE